MTTGIENWRPSGGTPCHFDYETSDICWESAACKFVKFCFSEEYYLLLSGVVHKLRQQPVKGSDPFLQLADLPEGKLEAEILPSFEPVNIDAETQEPGKTNNTKLAAI